MWRENPGTSLVWRIWMQLIWRRDMKSGLERAGAGTVTLTKQVINCDGLRSQ